MNIFKKAFKKILNTLRFLLRKVPAWSNLKRLGNSRVIRSSYYWFIFVPISARLFSSINNKLTITVFNAEWSLNLQLPFSWQIFFYSSCAFALASLIFQIYCPISIQKYDSYDEWSKTGKGSDSLIRAMWILLCNKRYTWPYKIPMKLFKRYVQNFTDYEIAINEATITKRIPTKLVHSNIKNGMEKGAFYFVHDTYNNVRVIHRTLCTILYTVGFILLLKIIIQNIEYVYSFTENI